MNKEKQIEAKIRLLQSIFNLLSAAFLATVGWLAVNLDVGKVSLSLYLKTVSAMIFIVIAIVVVLFFINKKIKEL